MSDLKYGSMRSNSPNVSPPPSAPLAAMFRMPTSFGPSAGPRNVAADRQRGRYVHHRTSLTVTALSDADALGSWLPPEFFLSGEPLISVNVMRLQNLGWLAGRGYNIVMVQIHNVVFRSKSEVFRGNFIPVIWESRADPIITGREELGMPKIFADIPDHEISDGDYRCSASWDGFRFFDMTAGDLIDAPSPTEPALPQLAHKYVPKTGQWGVADIDYITVSGRDPTEPVTHLHEYRQGVGEFRFNPASWEQLPTQHMIVNALASLPIERFVGATLRVTSQGEVDTVGGGNLYGHRVAL